MEWITSLKQAVNYMEDHLMDQIGAEDVADEVHMSSFYLQKSFKIMTGYKVIGFARDFVSETGYTDAPKFWDEFIDKYLKPLLAKEKPENEIEKVICDCKIGEFGVCIDDPEMTKKGMFRYMIASLQGWSRTGGYGGL